MDLKSIAACFAAIAVIWAGPAGCIGAEFPTES
jgi:hypothetical protein